MNTYTAEQRAEHAEMLANRVRKRHAHLSRKFARQGIEAFRLYDWDIPEVRAAVDWYAGHLVVAEYTRTQTGPEWLPEMGRAVAEALGVPQERVFLKKRRTGGGEGPRYKRMARGGLHFSLRERDLRFWINLSDRLDTGLFSDHRETRRIMRDLAEGSDFLNLYCYTGPFTCYAASGRARSSMSVDRSGPYLKWARANMELNGLSGEAHRFIRSDVGVFLEKARDRGQRFTLAMVDPPSFSTVRAGGEGFDVLRDHPRLLLRVFRIMAPGGIVFFSTNHQRFVPKFEDLPVDRIEELTPDTIPEDYRNKKVHRCWKIEVGG